MNKIFKALKTNLNQSQIVDEVVKPPTIWDFINAMTIKKEMLDFTDERINTAYDQYMINHWLSMSMSEVFDIAESANDMLNLTNEQHFKMMYYSLPKKKVYLEYMKASKDITKQEKRYIAHYFEVGLKEATEYIKELSDTELENILSRYRYGKNEMVKI